MIALDLDRGSRFGLALAGFLAPVALGLVLRLASDAGVVEEAIAPLRAVPCDARRLDAACGDGQLCVAGVCRRHRTIARSAEGGSCANGELCEPGLECHLGSCKDAAALPIADAMCRRPEVREVVEWLKGNCGSVIKTPAAETGLTSCTEQQWEGIARANDRFDLRLLPLPGASAVFFPTGEPSGHGRRFPSPSMRAHYVASLREDQDLLAALERASVVMVIGRASVTGDVVENLALARRRAEVAATVVREAFGKEPRVMLAWGLADEFPLPVDAMGRFLEPPIAASPEEARGLRARFESRGDNEAGMRASEALNQVALIVALPCEGREFFPEGAYYEPPKAR